MLHGRLNSENDANQELLGAFKIQEDVEMFTQLPDYGDFRLSYEMKEPPDVPRRICGRLPIPSSKARKRHLVNMHIPQELFKAIREIATDDNNDVLMQDRTSQLVAKIHISKTYNGIAGVDFVDYGDQETFLHSEDTLSRYSIIAFVAHKKRRYRR